MLHKLAQISLQDCVYLFNKMCFLIHAYAFDNITFEYQKF